MTFDVGNMKKSLNAKEKEKKKPKGKRHGGNLT
jgi:hypothetical protein